MSCGLCNKATTYPDGMQAIWNRDAAANINYSYDPAGNLTKVTLPTGAYLQYTYDTAHRLKE